jgi:hypothetical protein
MKKEKNLNKLKKELLKLFESSISISKAKLEKSNNNSISDPLLADETLNSSQIQKAENVNININLPNAQLSKDLKTTVKSVNSNKNYNVNIKKNETPVYLFLNKNYDDYINSSLIQPQNILNYNIEQNNIKTNKISFSDTQCR